MVEAKIRKKEDIFNYKGKWLNSNSYLKRAIAIAIYSIIGTIILYLLFAIILIVPAIIISAILAVFQYL